MKKKAVIVFMLGALVLFGSVGCVNQAQNRLMRVREVKYSADTAFALQMRTLIAVADEGWKKKHGLR